MRSLPEGPWPPEHLEYVPDCPVCGSSERSLRHERLRDETFFTAKGEWTLWECEQCGSGWLDPRPDEASIGDAYGHYYTHGGEMVSATNLRLIEKIKTALANDYSNTRFGLTDRPAMPGGRFIGQLFPSLTRSRNIMMRFLPKPTAGRDRLLDVGSGDSVFLARAERAGWIACGVEPDSRARATNVKFDVRPSLTDWEGQRFDAVTLNHSIEHMHDPVESLRIIHSLMRPRAMLFIDTPNFGSPGHQHFGRHWRGIEAPRHLVLFNVHSMQKVLEKTGFAEIVFVDRPSVAAAMTEKSRRISVGLDPESHIAVPAHAMPAPTIETKTTSRVEPKDREFITVTAVRTKT